MRRHYPNCHTRSDEAYKWFEKEKDAKLFKTTSGDRPEPFHVFNPPAVEKRSKSEKKKSKSEKKKRELHTQLGSEAAAELEDTHGVTTTTDSILKPLNISRPENAELLPLVNPATGEPAGEVLVSISLVPTSVADHSDYCVGVGRKEPNRFPILGEPVGRFSVLRLQL